MTRQIFCGRFAALTMGLVVACSPLEGGDGRTGSRVQPAAATIVNGEAISIIDVELEAISQGIIQPGDPFGTDHPAFQSVLDQLIDQRLLAQEALRLQLDKTDDAQHRLGVIRERILGNLLIENLVETRFDEATIAEMYADQVKLQQLDDEVKVSHILTETKQEAEAVSKRIADGGDFAALAFEHSRDSATRINGGALGYVAPNELADPFASIIGDTQVGAVSAPFESERGWHILRVEDRRQQAPKTLEEMRPEIIRFLTLSALNDTLRDLRVKARITPSYGAPAPADAAAPTPNDTTQTAK